MASVRRCERSDLCREPRRRPSLFLYLQWESICLPDIRWTQENQLSDPKHPDRCKPIFLFPGNRNLKVNLLIFSFEFRPSDYLRSFRVCTSIDRVFYPRFFGREKVEHRLYLQWETLFPKKNTIPSPFRRAARRWWSFRFALVARHWSEFPAWAAANLSSMTTTTADWSKVPKILHLRSKARTEKFCAVTVAEAFSFNHYLQFKNTKSICFNTMEEISMLSAHSHSVKIFLL